MSLIGRIFIVLNLGMAAAFLGWAANALHTTDDYKQQLADAQAAALTEKTDLEGQISDLNAKLSTATADLGIRVNELDDAKSQRDSFQTQLETANAEAAKLSGQLDTITATLSDYNDTISQVTSTKDDATERANEAERERDDAVEAQQTAELAQAEAEERASGLEQTIADMQVSMTDLQGEYSALETQLQMLIEITNVDPQQITRQPQIEGAVLEARHDLPPGLVMLNVGEADGVMRGFTFEIYRGAQYKGQVRVVDVQENVSSCVILNAVEGTTMAQGDKAGTRI